MYQSIDADSQGNEKSPKTSRKRAIIGAAILGGIVLLALVSWFTLSKPRAVDPNNAEAQIERRAYLAAISETDMDMRRARLIDFMDAYPESARRDAAAAQRAILDKIESADWADFSHIMFDLDISAEDKLAALSQYERKWSPVILGGREDEIKILRDDLEVIEGDEPSRELEIDPEDPSSETDAMAGGTGNVRGTYPADTQRPRTNAGAADNTDVEISPAKVVRSRQPTYPSRALRNDVEAVVTLRLFVDARGRVSTTELISVDAERYQKDFVKAAERAALRTRFRPKWINGRAVESQEEKRYRFEIAE